MPPVPDRATVRGLLLDVSETVSVPAREPDAVGLNVTLIVQLAEAARLLPHVLLAIKKSPWFVPVVAMLLIVIEALLPFFRVAVCDPLVEPTLTLPKENDVGLILTTPAPPVPNPERVTFCGLVLSESLKFSVAFRVPLVVGAKTTLAVQLAPAASDVPQVLLEIWKSPAFAPAKVMLLIVMAAAFPFVNVMAFGAPLLPTATDAQLRLAGATVAAAKQFVPWRTPRTNGRPNSARAAGRRLPMADTRDEK